MTLISRKKNIMSIELLYLAAMLSGVRYWQHGWSLTKRHGTRRAPQITSENREPGSVGCGVVVITDVEASFQWTLRVS